MSGPYRLVALDIDGTVLRSDRTVSERTRAAVGAARHAGARVVFVTGRRYPAARRIVDQIGRDFPLVLHNGALVVEPPPEGTPEGAFPPPRVVRCVPLARATAVEAIRIGRQCNADPVVHCGRGGEGRLLAAAVSPTNPLLAYYLDRSRADVFWVEDLEAALGEDPLQVMFGGEIAAIGALWPRLVEGLGARARVERTTYAQGGVAILDVLDPGVGKAKALAFLQRRWSIAAAETLAIGDNWNDREMLEQAGRGLVMGNADPELRRAGLGVLPTNDEDGVAVAIERYVLAT